ncbi:MAG: DUF4129 domain-containing protein [Fimbriimonadaceae bacterium]|nr:DUF4129 domain-containing protein [Fimbriimonadaceae bacterium]QYK59376.1 MAG: DUF4129 domain-containing protein [Fimbriimonadaceae bacterium]
MRPERGPLDHLLVLLGCGSAVYAVGMSLGKPALAHYLAIAVFFSLATGYLLSVTAAKSWLGKIDGYAWAFLAIASAGLVLPLNQVLPDDGVPFNLMAAGWLSWMVILCGFVTWRDQTLLFLNLPSLAMFGLVGTFDYWLGIAFFFLFLASSAVLYARVHFRTMAESAKALGSPSVDLLRRDSWRWVAGPEWALASAFVVILVSLGIAPLLQFSLSGVTSAVRTNISDQARDQRRVSGQDVRADQPIGTGPVSLTEEPVFDAKAPGVTHLRTRTFAVYGGRGWSATRLRAEQAFLDPRILTLSQDSPRGREGGYMPWSGPAPAEPVESFGRKKVELRRFRLTQRIVPSPGPVSELITNNPSRFTFMPTGAVRPEPPLQAADEVALLAQVPDMSIDPGEARVFGATEEFQSLLRMSHGIPYSVVRFAQRATEGAMTDYEKVMRIKEAVERRAVYNLKAKPVPAGNDPVAYFLEESREGYCDLFASAVVLSARALGFPARYATGYLINERPARDGFATVRSRDAHAWAEVYFENWGWTVVDATEGAQAVEGAGRGSETSALAQVKWEETLNLLMNAVIALVAVLAAVLWVKSTKEERTAAATGRAEASRVYAAFLSAVQRAVKRPRRFSQTTTEYIEAVAEQLGEQERQAKTLAAALDDCLFGPVEPNREKLRDLREAVKVFRANLSKPGAAPTHAV